MRFFGINHGPHDGGIACFGDDGELLLYSQTERLNRKKTHGSAVRLDGLLRRAGLDAVQPTDLFFSTWPNYYPAFLEYQKFSRDFFLQKHSPLSGFSQEQRVHFLNHHTCHAAASWMFRESEPSESLYVVLDGRGFREDGSEGCYSVGTISSGTLVEHEHTLDYKNYSPFHRLNRIKLPNTHSLQVAGKLMGLAGFVPQDQIQYLPPTHSLTSLNIRLDEEGLTTDTMAECASLYTSYIQDVKDHLATVLAAYPQRDVVVGGGVFLALELNTWLVEQGRRLIFAPCVNDSGIALGSAAYGYFLAKRKWPRALTNPYLEWGPQEERNLYQSPADAARCLADGEVLGVLTGQGEAGPRALGHRSLLAVPTMENAHKVSVEIKGREYYRPVAPIVTERDFAQWFTGPAGRYMQYRNFCTSAAKKTVPGVVHHDNTARAQVLRPDDHPWLHDVLVEVGKLTGAECLINTSLNDRGHPICNSLADALAEFGSANIRLVSF